MGKRGIVVSILMSLLCWAASADGRSMQYKPGMAADARAWQHSVRMRLLEQLQLADLAARHKEIGLDASVLKTETFSGYTLQELRVRSTPGRFMHVVVAKPEKIEGRLPAVVCLHGHQGTRWTPFDPKAAIYKCFGEALVNQGFIVISTDVGQHEVYESGRTLMGERLWDCIRCVDYLEGQSDVDPKRIGCAGLSLGGEMSMWLGAMDERISATVSAGFLTYMDQMEKNHCMCWKFDGLRELVDFPDLYALIAPRPLQCQNGLKEPVTQFTVPLAQKAMQEVLPAYRDLGAPENAELRVHDGAHEIDLPGLIRFFETRLK